MQFDLGPSEAGWWAALASARSRDTRAAEEFAPTSSEPPSLSHRRTRWQRAPTRTHPLPTRTIRAPTRQRHRCAGLLADEAPSPKWHRARFGANIAGTSVRLRQIAPDTIRGDRRGCSAPRRIGEILRCRRAGGPCTPQWRCALRCTGGGHSPALALMRRPGDAEADYDAGATPTMRRPPNVRRNVTTPSTSANSV